jgi:integration host factor subunit beta
LKNAVLWLSNKNTLTFSKKLFNHCTQNEIEGEAMNKSDLIESLSKETGLPVRKAEEVVNTVFSSMADSLAKGDRVEIRGFGSFKVKNYEGYTGRNPKTGELIEVMPKKLPFFKCGKDLKDRVDIL